MHLNIIITIYEEASFRSQENTTYTRQKIGFTMDTFLKFFLKVHYTLFTIKQLYFGCLFIILLKIKKLFKTHHCREKP
jgi:hypothetical protein